MNVRILLALFLAAATGLPTAATPDQGAEAATLWEQAVAAKGGRERLLAVRNLVVTSPDLSRTTRPLEWGQRLYVFPSRLWQFSDSRVIAPGPSVMIADVERQVGWNDSGPFPQLRDELWGLNGFVLELRLAQVLYLLETPYLKPEPVTTRRDRVGLTAVDVVETRVQSADMRVDYYLDRQSHLPLRVVLFYTFRLPPGLGNGPREVPQEDRYTLSEYADVQGFQMPKLVVFEGNRSTTAYRINVEYDERIFTDPQYYKEHHDRVALDGWEKQ